MLLFSFLSIYLFAKCHGFAEIDGKVVNGAAATKLIPYQASIRVTSRDYLKFGNGHRCGGVLVNTKAVVTAAHCLMYDNVELKTYQIYIVLGSLNRYEFTKQTLIRYIKNVIVHSDYKRSQRFADDIGLVILRVSVPLTDNIHPIPLIDHAIEAGTNCQVSGFGATYWTGKMPKELRQANVSIVHRDACNSTSSYNGIITLGMVCANAITQSGQIVDVCQGDSGGPLQCDENLVGLASFGAQCGAVYYLPGVFVDIYYYRNWIMDHWNGATMQKVTKPQFSC